MAFFLRSFAAATVASLALAGGAQAAGGHYVFEGGSRFEQTQVVKALNASAFHWNVVPETITIEIRRGAASEASRGRIVLDANLLDAGRFSWGVVQHEYAHQVDFFCLHDDQRAELGRLLGGIAWWSNGLGTHSDYTSERFASSVAWAYWPAPDNALRPSGPQDEGGELAPAAFRTALSAILATALPSPLPEPHELR